MEWMHLKLEMEIEWKKGLILSCYFFWFLAIKDVYIKLNILWRAGLLREQWYHFGKPKIGRIHVHWDNVRFRNKRNYSIYQTEINGPMGLFRVTISIRHLDFAHTGHKLPFLALVGRSCYPEITQIVFLQLWQK